MFSHRWRRNTASRFSVEAVTQVVLTFRVPVDRDDKKLQPSFKAVRLRAWHTWLSSKKPKEDGEKSNEQRLECCQSGKE